MLEEVKFEDEIIAIIVRNNYQKSGVSFFTPSNFSQQLAYLQHPKGKVIDAHVHNQVKREVYYTKEIIFIRKGKLRVDLYCENKNYLESKMLFSGDVILLSSGGHGFEVLEDVEMLEVKQGPYAGENDKTRFEGIHKKQSITK